MPRSTRRFLPAIVLMFWLATPPAQAASPEPRPTVVVSALRLLGPEDHPCVQPVYFQDARYVHPDGSSESLHRYFEQHPERAARWYRYNRELRERYQAKKQSGVCP